jgi:hypothetical protein
MPADTKHLMQMVAGALLVAFGLASLAIYVFDSVIGRAVDPITQGQLAVIVGIIGTVLGMNVGSQVSATATDKANLNTANIVAAANGTGGAVAKAALGVPDEHAGEHTDS